MFEHPTQEELESRAVVHVTNCVKTDTDTITRINDTFGIDNVRVGRPIFSSPEATPIERQAMVGVFATGEAYEAAVAQSHAARS